MATNLKGKGRFVSLLLLHGEKIAIGVVGLAALWIVYKSFKVPTARRRRGKPTN